MSVAHLSDEQLALFGYNLVKQNEEFSIYNHVYTGEEHITDRANPRLYVEDINDAVAMRAADVVVIEGEED